MYRAVRLLLIPVFPILLLPYATGVAQLRFEVPLTITDGQNTETIYFGILPSANFCIVAGDSINGRAEFFLPPIPPGGVFDTRFSWPRSGSNLVCFDQGSWYDYRPYIGPAQRDTFRVKSQMGAGTILMASWPAGLSTYFQTLTFRYFDGSGNVNVNMLTSTSENFTVADPPTVNIYSNTVTVSVEQTSSGIPEEFALRQNYPNPFNPSTTISFDIQQAAMTDVSVYDILGQKVATLASELLVPGTYSVVWNGKTDAGSDVSSGVYFVRMSAHAVSAGVADGSPVFSALRKLMLVR